MNLLAIASFFLDNLSLSFTNTFYKQMSFLSSGPFLKKYFHEVQIWCKFDFALT